MRAIGEDIKANIDRLIGDWERLVIQEPWYSLPKQHRVNNLPAVVVGLVDAALCDSGDLEVHRRKVRAAAEHGQHRRLQEIHESLILTEYHLLRQALWYYLVEKHGPSDEVVQAIMRIDTAITVATNASMWGYYRSEVESMGKWDESIERLALSSRLLP